MAFSRRRRSARCTWRSSAPTSTTAAAAAAAVARASGIAPNDDIAALGTDCEALCREVNVRFAEVPTGLRMEVAGLRGDLESPTTGSRAELRATSRAFRAELDGRSADLRHETAELRTSIAVNAAAQLRWLLGPIPAVTALAVTVVEPI
jgi:hypothetical protein